MLTAMMQVNSEPITLSGGCQSLAPESTENSLESGSHFHSKCCDTNTIHRRQVSEMEVDIDVAVHPGRVLERNLHLGLPHLLPCQEINVQLILSSREGGVDFRSLCYTTI